jgi:2-succinyl-5-enolpyruvyl-6-hydroxy-3-cyclohexene-1-carboxylate synthase
VSDATDTYLLLRAFVQELARCGMRAACTSPGSRSAPLVLSLARQPEMRCYSHIDERCSGFFALGLAKASGLPAAVACTSGTAAAELLPAAVEAHQARVPMLVLTADRPPELREVGAGQTVDQLKLLGGAAKWFFEVGVHEADEERLRWMRTLACRAFWTSLEGRPGVVHLNFPLREPLVPAGALPDDDTGRPDGRPYVARPWSRGAHAHALSTFGALLAGADRGVVVAGRDERDAELAHQLTRFCEAARWPLLADPLSGARSGESAIAHYDALLRDDRFTAAMQPDLILRVGDLPTSKPLREWLAGLGGVRQIALDPESAWQDPAAVLERSFALDPVLALEGIGPTAAAPERWLQTWRSADERAARAIGRALAQERLSEPAVAAELGELLPGTATVFVASSMPVRDLETFWPARPEPPRALCNRGANGIDGTVSSAFGVSAALEGPVVLLIGDVALTHDLGGLLAATRLGLRLVVVLLNNDGGGIFDFLAVAGAPIARDHAPGDERQAEDLYTRHIATPPLLDFARAAELFGVGHDLVGDRSGLRAAVERALAQEGTTIIEIRTEREANVALHRHVWREVGEELAALSPPATGAAPPA